MSSRKRPRATQRATGTGAVRKLPSGRWQARWRDEDGKLHPAPVTFDTKQDAGTWLDRSDLAAVPAERPDPTLREFASTFMAERELKPRTRADYTVLLDGRILPDLGDLRLSRITPHKVHAWHATLPADTPTLRARTYGLLRTVMIAAWQRDLIAANPCRVRGAGKVKSKHMAKPATLAELDKLSAAMPEPYRAMIPLGAWCALRYGEATELRRGDIDLKAAVAHIRRGVVRVGPEHIVGTPKSHAGVRDVSIPPHVVPVLADHLSRHVGPEPGALLFPSAQGRHLSSSSFYTMYWPARTAAGRPDLHFHDLRHTGLTLAAATGATLADLMARAGHSTPAAALVYQHSAADRDRAIAEALSGFAGDNVVTLSRKGAG
jgi:integrase